MEVIRYTRTTICTRYSKRSTKTTKYQRTTYHSQQSRLLLPPNQYRDVTEHHIQSYSRKANLWDNACIESFHALIKREYLHFHVIQNLKHAHQLVFDYINTFYSTVRIHEACGYKTPLAFESNYQPINQSTK